MAQRLDAFGDATTYGLYPVGWALAMNTPYQWTKQVASHYGGTRDGMIVRWGDRVPDPGAVRHQWHHVIDVLPTVLEAAGLPHPQVVDGVTQMPIEGVSMLGSILDGGTEERRTTQYFEMCGNRGIYHEGWTAVTQHGVPWRMVPEGLPAFEDDTWELYDTRTDWTQAHDLARIHPDKLAELQELFRVEAEKYHVFPLDDRVTERENPEVAGRLDLLAGRTSLTYHPGMGRFTEETTLNVKNRSHTVTASFTVPPEGADGVLVAQGGRFGGWALYLFEGRLSYAYNCYGREVTVVRTAGALAAGGHEVQMDFEYDGGGAGLGANITLRDGRDVVRGRLSQTTAFYFSFDETLNVGRDRGTPVTDDYPPLDNAFTGRLEWVRIDLRDEPLALSDEDRDRARLASQ
jgi:arylsulfatase